MPNPGFQCAYTTKTGDRVFRMRPLTYQSCDLRVELMSSGLLTILAHQQKDLFGKEASG